MLNANDFIQSNLSKLNSYFNEVDAGIGIGRYERLAVERSDILKDKYDFRIDELKKVLKFFSLLHLAHKNEVKQIELLPVNIFWLASILCFYYPGTDNRVVDQVYITVAKKNGKTSFFACLLLYFCLVQHLNSHIVVLAADTKQAKNSLDICKNIITNSPALEGMFRINRNLIYQKTDTGLNQIEILSPRSGKALQGRNISFSLIDEFFASKDSEGQLKLKSSSAERINPLQAIITTAGNNKSISPANNMQEISKNILNGVIENDKFFCQIFSLDDPEGEIKMLEDPNNYFKVFRKSNPAINHTVSQQFLIDEFKATKTFPDKYTTFLTDHLNVWQDSNGTDRQFIDDDIVKTLMQDDKRIPTGSTVHIGLDTSMTTDLTSITMLWYNRTADEFVSETIPILPSIDKVRTRKDGQDLSKWIGTFDQVMAGDKYIVQNSEPYLDEQPIIDILLYLKTRYKIVSVGYDPWNSQILAYRLGALGIQVHPLKQGIETLAYPLRYFERYLLQGKFFMKKNPCVRWQFQNVVILRDMNNNGKINKMKSRETVDSIVSNVCAIAEWLAYNQNAVTFYNQTMNPQA